MAEQPPHRRDPWRQLAPLGANVPPEPIRPQEPCKRFTPCVDCISRVYKKESYYSGLTFTMGDEARACQCGRVYYHLDIPIITVDSAIIPNTTGRNGTKSAIGIYFSYASTENRPIYVSGGHPSDNVNPGVACLKELAEIFAGKEGIRTGVEVLHRMKIKSSKMIIKTPSATFVNMMTQQSNFNHWADNNANVHSVLFNEAKEQVKRARTLGYEVVFWLATPPETSHAVELAYHALATFVPLAIA